MLSNKIDQMSQEMAALLNDSKKKDNWRSDKLHCVLSFIIVFTCFIINLNQT